MSSSGAMKGAVTYTKFQVKGEMPESLHQVFMARLRTRAFRALAPEDEDTLSAGWVPIERPYDEEIVFRNDGVFFGNYLNLAMRLDAWKFPSALVKAKMVAAERQWKQKTGRERLSRAEKVELRDVVVRKLRRDGVPVTKIADFSWDTESGAVRFFGRSKTLLEHFHELFEKTFGARLVPASPYTIGMLLGLPEEHERALAVVEPSILHERGAA
jgi:class 3 adenylate cyclase